MVGRLVLSSPLLSVKEAINRTQPYANAAPFALFYFRTPRAVSAKRFERKRGRRARRLPAADHESRDGFCASLPFYDEPAARLRNPSSKSPRCIDIGERNGEKLVLACRNFFRGNWPTELRRSGLGNSGGEFRNFENRTIEDNNYLPLPPLHYYA